MPPESVTGAVETLGEQGLLVREQEAFLARNRREAWRIRLMQVALFASFLLVWWSVSGRLVDRLFVSDPITVALTLFNAVVDGTLWWHLQQTLIEMALGYVLEVSVHRHHARPRGVELAVGQEHRAPTHAGTICRPEG